MKLQHCAPLTKDYFFSSDYGYEKQSYGGYKEKEYEYEQDRYGYDDRDKGKFNSKATVWKFHDFSITQILREINFGDSRRWKSAILTHLEAPNVHFR